MAIAKDGEKLLKIGIGMGIIFLLLFSFYGMHCLKAIEDQPDISITIKVGESFSLGNETITVRKASASSYDVLLENPELGKRYIESISKGRSLYINDETEIRYLGYLELFPGTCENPHVRIEIIYNQNQ